MATELLKNSRINLVDFESELKQELDNFNRYIDTCSKFNDTVTKELGNFKMNSDSSGSREKALKRRMEQVVKRQKKQEDESSHLLAQIKENYDQNISKLRDHQQQQVSNILNKHKLEIQKWKSKYEKIKYEKKFNHDELLDESPETELLQYKLDKVNGELCTFKTRTVSMEQELCKMKKEKSSIQENFKQLQKDYENLKNQIAEKDKDLAQQKTKFKDMEAKIKSKDDDIKSYSEKLKSSKSDYDAMKLRFENLSKDYKEAINLEKHNKISNSEVEEEPCLRTCQGECKKELASLRADFQSVSKKANLSDLFRSEWARVKKEVSMVEEELKKEKKNCSEHMEQLERYRVDIEKITFSVEDRDNEIMKLKCKMEENSKNMDLKLKELNDIKRSEKKWKEKCVEFEKKYQLLLNEIECIKRKNAALRVEIELKNADIENLNSEKAKLGKSHEALKKVCKDLESQVNNYSQKYTDVSSAKKSLIKQKCSINDEMSTLRDELHKSQEEIQQLTREKEEILVQLSNKETEIKNLYTQQKIQYNKLLHENELEQNKCKRLEESIEWLRENIDEYEGQMIIHNEEQAAIQGELSRIKEEAANHITKISMLEKEKFELLEELEQRGQSEVEFIERLNLLREHLQLKEEEMTRDKLVLGETHSQQMKLIKLLQDKINDINNKKKLSFFKFSPKVLPDNYTQKYEEAYKSLKSEKMKNLKLNEQLKEAHQDLEKNISEVKNLKFQVYELRNQLIQNIMGIENRSMIHEVPHRFVPVKIKLTSTCMSCAKKIFFGQKARRCQDCHSTVHDCCPLVNNCAMSIDAARQAIYDNGSNESSNEAMSDCSDNIEPSAPEISPTINKSFEKMDNIKNLEDQLDRILGSNDLGLKTSSAEHFSFSDSVLDILKQ